MSETPLCSGAPSRHVDAILGGKLDAFVHDLPELPELDNLFAPEVRGLSVKSPFYFFECTTQIMRGAVLGSYVRQDFEQ